MGPPNEVNPSCSEASRTSPARFTRGVPCGCRASDCPARVASIDGRHYRALHESVDDLARPDRAEGAHSRDRKALTASRSVDRLGPSDQVRHRSTLVAASAGISPTRTNRTRSSRLVSAAAGPCNGNTRRRTSMNRSASFPAWRPRSAGRSTRIREQRHPFRLNFAPFAHVLHIERPQGRGRMIRSTGCPPRFLIGKYARCVSGSTATTWASGASAPCARFSARPAASLNSETVPDSEAT